jgi:hypothetical protein
MNGSSMDDGGDKGDGLLYDGGVRRRIESSIPSLSSSTSHLRFLVRFAGGDIGSGGSAGAWALAVATVTGDGQAVMMAEGHRWQRRRHLRVFAATICVGKRQMSVTSWKPVRWFTETRAAWPEVIQMSYSDMKSNIEGELVSEPARIAAHVGATLWALLVGRV